jgi:uracil-DNA glycosylase
LPEAAATWAEPGGAATVPLDAGPRPPAHRLGQPVRALLAQDHGGWQPLLQRWADSAAGRALIDAVDARVAAGAEVYPADVFAALRLTPPEAVKVVILGQDPYHGPGQAEGLAFSVPAGVRPPPSLRQIHAERSRDLGLPEPGSGSLRPWAARGVLLLNTTLTVEQGQPGRHAKLGWSVLTDAIIEHLSMDPEPKVFLLWGAQAQAVAAARARAAGHGVLCCNHPSPLSARRGPVPFVGCGHFGAASRMLADAGRGGVDWSLP